MKITIKYYGASREVTRKNHEIITIQTKLTLKDIISILTKRYGKPLTQLMLCEDGEPSDYLTYFIEGVNANSLQGFSTELRDGDTVVIAPTIVGG